MKTKLTIFFFLDKGFFYYFTPTNMIGFFAKRINQNCIELIHIQDYSNGSRLTYRKTMRAITLERDMKKVAKTDNEK